MRYYLAIKKNENTTRDIEIKNKLNKEQLPERRGERDNRERAIQEHV